MQWRMLTPTSAEAKPTEQDAGSTADYPEPPEGSQGEALEVQGQGHAQGIGLGHLCPPQAPGGGGRDRALGIPSPDPDNLSEALTCPGLAALAMGEGSEREWLRCREK